MNRTSFLCGNRNGHRNTNVIYFTERKHFILKSRLLDVNLSFPLVTKVIMSHVFITKVDHQTKYNTDHKHSSESKSWHFIIIQFKLKHYPTTHYL
jgi:hypothetical protein